MKSTIYLLVFVLLGFIACEPAIEDKIDLPPAPSEASFDIIELEASNTYSFVSTTPGAFLYSWDLGNGTTGTSEEIEGYFPEKGGYLITLRVFNAGGHVTSTKTLNVPENAVIEAEPCEAGTLTEYLSDCDQKTWSLNPAEGALLVGPPGLTETWWQNDINVVSERFCAWDDEWTFFEDGTMTYDTKGDIWGEDYLGFDFSCVATADMPADVAAWGDGTHMYIANGATNELALIGNGAFIGIPKAANGQEVGFPQSGVTYTVTEMSTNTDGKDLLVVQVDYTAGIWQFTLVEK